MEEILIECNAIIVKKSKSTISRYKKLQKESFYESKKVFEFDRKYYRQNGFDFNKYLKDYKGIFLNLGDTFYFSPISTRKSRICLKVG